MPGILICMKSRMDAGGFTIPRELHIKDGHMYQQPVKELEALRTAKLIAGVMEIGHEYELQEQLS